MAAIVVTRASSALRLDDAEANTGWVNDGGGGPPPPAEASFPYQGTNLVNRKVTSTTGQGIAYVPTNDSGSATDMRSVTGTRETVILKLIVTDYGGLQTTNGVRIKIGSGSGAYYMYIVAGSNAKIPSLDAYPAKGGIVIVPINPNIAGYRDSTTGTPNLQLVDYFSLFTAFSASTAKSENVGLDAIDIINGLELTGGDGADADGVFEDFFDFDEGTVNNRYGCCTKIGDVYYVFGLLQIGTLAASGGATFQDSGKTIVFPDGYYDQHWSGIQTSSGNISGAAPDIDIINCTFISEGTTTIVDTRAKFVCGSPSATVNGTVIIDGCTFVNMGRLGVEGVAGNRFINNVCIDCNELLHFNGDIDNCSFINPTTATGVPFMDSDDPGLISNCTFESNGVGHAIEITQTGTYTFTGNKFVGYDTTGAGSNPTPSSGGNDVAIYNNSGGAVTLNIGGGGDTPAVRNGASATTVVNNNITVTLTGMKDNTEVRVLLNSDNSQELAGIESATAGTTDNRSFAFSLAAGTVVDIVIFNINYRLPPNNRITGFTIPTSDGAIPISQVPDRGYSAT
jgi:hypothetical protein